MDEKRQTRQKILIAVSVSVVVALLILFALSGGNYELLKSLWSKDRSDAELSEQLKAFGWRGHTVISVLAALQVVCTFLPAEPVQVLGGFAFGFPIGLLCCMVGVLLGNTLIFMLQKTFGDRLRGFFVKKLNLDLEKIAASSKVTVIIFVLYFLPAIPYGMICFFAASIGMSYRRYITVTALGALPSVCIGVGLGYMAIVSNAVFSLCVFGVLLLLIFVMICKRDVLFSKLNGYADRNKKASKGKVQEANGFLLTVLYFGVRMYLFLCGVRIKTVSKVGRLKEPSIVLCNHGSFIDFIYAAALLRKYKPHFIVARLYFYNTYLDRLLRKVGAFPKSMFAMDMENAKNCLMVLKNGKILAMMPEARLSTVGRFEDIQDSTYAFIKKSAVDVYSIKLSGDYLADPKWGKGFRRGALVEAELDILYTAEQVSRLSLQELELGIRQRLSYDELDWLQQQPKLRYRSARLAEGLENILSVCPICGQKHTVTTEKKKLFCSHCGYLTSLDSRYRFDDGFRFADFAAWYDWQTELLKKEIAENEHFALSSEVELRLPGTGKGLTRHGGHGICTLDRSGLTYLGTKDGQDVELHFSVRRIYRLLFGAGKNFEIYDGAQILFFVPKEPRSAVDWYMASKLLYDQETTGGVLQ